MLGQEAWDGFLEMMALAQSPECSREAPHVTDSTVKLELGQISLCHGACLVHCVIFRSIPGLYPLDDGSTLSPCPSCDDQKCFQTLPSVSWWARHPAESTTIERWG